MYSSVKLAIEDLQQGKMVLVTDDENRENEADLVIASEDASPDVINFMATHGRGLICVSIEKSKARELDLNPMVVNNTDRMGTAFTVSVDDVETSTGISAYERSKTIKSLLASTDPLQFRRPGHVFPLIGRSGGVLKRPGHTEASIDLARLAGKQPSGVICEVMDENGRMLKGTKLFAYAKKHNIKLISIAALIQYRKSHEQLVKRQSVAKLPTKYGHFSIIGYLDVITNEEHICLTKGDIEGKDEVLVRLHSECLTGDGFGSLRCDCGQQLARSMELIDEAGNGVIVYLRQEGRGIGLLNKINAYTLQDQGMDTVEANEHLGFGADEREYYVAKQILNDLDVNSIKLITNNPQKIESLGAMGIKVEKRVDLNIDAHPENENYLKVKKEKMNHY